MLGDDMSIIGIGNETVCLWIIKQIALIRVQ